MTEEVAAVEKERNRMRVADHRKKKQEEAQYRVGQIRVSSLVGFKTPQLLGKAKSRLVNALPSSPRKIKAVVASLAQGVGLSLQESSKHVEIQRAITELENKVANFYRNSSWVCPGKKDVVILRGPNRQKIPKQKHYMVTTLKEAHAMFLEENQDTKISFSKFANLRPGEVMLQSSIPQNSCLCKYHENVRLLLQALSTAGLPIPTDFRTFISLVVCDQAIENCMTGVCDLCPGLSNLAPPQNMAAKEVCWKQWPLKQSNSKLEYQGSLKDCFEQLQQKLDNFLKHTWIKRIQSHEFQKERESVKSDSQKAIIQVDFAENYATKTQDEVQSAYWSYNQVTLFTVCVWEQGGAHSIVMASDHLSHDRYAVNVFLKRLLSWIDEKIRPFNKFVFFSDGAAQQFKQRYLLCSLTLLDRQITWNFFGTSHGKGPVDGLGGTVKRAVARQVMARKEEAKTSEDFVHIAQKHCPNVSLLHINRTEIEESKQNLDKDLEQITAIPNTKQMHKFTVQGPYVIRCQKHAAAADFVIHCFRRNAADEDTVASDMNPDSTICDCVSPNENHLKTVNYSGDQIAVDSCFNSGNADNLQDLKWKWVMVKYSNDKNAKDFIGQVIDVANNKVVVKFLKKILGKLIWPEREDIDEIEATKIVSVLKEPQMDRRGTLSFQ